MILLDRDELGHWFIENLAARTTRECGVNWRSGNHNRNVCRALRRGLFRHARLGISLKVRRMVRRLIGILKLGFGSVDLKG